MKRAALLKDLKKGRGYSHIQETGPHTNVYAKCGAHVQVPRHREVKKWTAKAILKRATVIGLIVFILYLLCI